MTTATPEGAGHAGPSLGVLLFIPYRHMEQRILDAVVAAGHPITLVQARLFQRVDPNGSRLTALAAAAQASKQAAKFLVDQLEAAGYVERVPDPDDGRARLVCITSRGHDVIRIATAVQSGIEDEWSRHLGGQADEELRRHLLRLREITDPFA
ncbi:MarR family winged helix-turn-helix transcriptional regulator [uncultured Friedmanniella sp.]|uniref:MarR family winged helix-turn-helix transcriptional regulator n=1 Tax=uncultured Friedmanniella sp. TaxID=335381 RepID=UPI0035CA1DEA